jgi:hypothetical protein
MSRLGRILVNGALFNAAWLGLVGLHNPWLAPPIVALHLSLHGWLMGARLREFQFLGLLALAGFALDSLLFISGILAAPGVTLLPPLWLALLWPAFGTTLLYAFAGLRAIPLLAAAAGAIGGGTSYLAGVKLSPVEFGLGPIVSLAVLAVLWAILMPLLLTVAHRYVHQPLRAMEISR